MKIRHIIWLSVIISILVTGSLVAIANEGPAKIVKTALTQITKILDDQAIDLTQKRSRIVNIAKPLFDLPLMAKLTLGKEQWGALSKGQRERFTSLYSTHLEKSYIGKVELYNNDQIKFKPEIKKNNKVFVPTEMISKGKVVPITYKFYQSKGGWKIYDAEISGTSVIVSHRTEYSAIIKNGSIDDLLAKLKQTVK